MSHIKGCRNTVIVPPLCPVAGLYRAMLCPGLSQSQYRLGSATDSSSSLPRGVCTPAVCGAAGRRAARSTPFAQSHMPALALLPLPCIRPATCAISATARIYGFRGAGAAAAEKPGLPLGPAAGAGPAQRRHRRSCPHQRRPPPPSASAAAAAVSAASEEWVHATGVPLLKAMGKTASLQGAAVVGLQAVALTVVGSLLLRSLLQYLDAKVGSGIGDLVGIWRAWRWGRGRSHAVDGSWVLGFIR